MRNITPMQRTLLTVPTLVLALALSACGGDDGAETAPENDGAAAAEQTAEDFVQAVHDRDGEAGCALLDDPAQDLVAQTQDADDCATAFPDYAESLPDADGRDDLPLNVLQRSTLWSVADRTEGRPEVAEPLGF